MTVKLPKGFKTPEQFIAYCENKCEHQPAWFSGEEVETMIKLADVARENYDFTQCSTYKLQREMQELCLAARYWIAQDSKRSGVKFDERKFRHLQMVVDNS
jgi:hypothetical protein